MREEDEVGEKEDEEGGGNERDVKGRRGGREVEEESAKEEGGSEEEVDGGGGGEATKARPAEDVAIPPHGDGAATRRSHTVRRRRCGPSAEGKSFRASGNNEGNRLSYRLIML